MGAIASLSSLTKMAPRFGKVYKTLVVEDNQEDRDAITNTLQSLQLSNGDTFAVTSTDNDEDARKTIKNGVDVLVSDGKYLDFPGGTTGFYGPRLVKDTRRDNPEAVILGMSWDSGFKDYFLSAGANGFVWKRRGNVLKALKTLLDKPQTA